MIEGQPSQTAFMTAVQRAHHYLTAPEPKILRDDLALALSGVGSLEGAQSFIDAMVARFAVLSDQETAATFMHRIDAAVCMRSRVVEERLAIARERGMQQLVILGAGLDSLAYRRPDLTESLDVFEVDHPSTQVWKRERIKEADITLPKNVKFVGFDFENQTLAQALEQGGVAADAMSFFTWLGVHMYLTDDAVKSTLNVLGSYPAGSEIVMDFISPSYVLEGGVAEQSVDYLQKVVTEMGEPVKSQYYESELEERLKTGGFTQVEFLNARWLKDNYLDGVDAAFDMPDKATSILAATV